MSAYSLKSLAVADAAAVRRGRRIDRRADFDARVAWPAYDWMGVAKAALESTSRYLARELGPRNIRVNLIAAGPIRTMAAQEHPRLRHVRGRLGRAARRSAGTTPTPTPVARSTLALLSDWFPATTGEIVHVDGGFHAMGV